MIARIVKIVSKHYQLLQEDGSRNDAIVMGKVRLQMTPCTGDMVEADLINGQYVIQKILPRKNHLIRPFVANVDQALIVMSVKDPDFSAVLVDRLCFLIVNAGITPLLCVTKTDLGISEETEARIREYENGPMQVIRTSKETLDPNQRCSIRWNRHSIWKHRRSPKLLAGASIRPGIMSCIRLPEDSYVIRRDSVRWTSQK